MDALFQSHTGRPGAPQVGEVPAEQSRQPRGQDGGGGQACRKACGYLGERASHDEGIASAKTLRQVST